MHLWNHAEIHSEVLYNRKQETVYIKAGVIAVKGQVTEWTH